MAEWYSIPVQVTFKTSENLYSQIPAWRTKPTSSLNVCLGKARDWISSLCVVERSQNIIVKFIKKKVIGQSIFGISQKSKGWPQVGYLMNTESVVASRVRKINSDDVIILKYNKHYLSTHHNTVY